MFLVFSLHSIALAQNYPQFSCPDIISSSPQASFPENYTAICTDLSSIKYIRVNYHFILKDDGTGNFNENGDGQGNGNQYNGFVRSNEIIGNANAELAAGTTMWLPSGTQNSVVPTRVRYILTGVYFHRDSKLYNKSYSSSDIWSGHIKYDINADNTVNVYDTKLTNASGVATFNANQFDYTVFCDNYAVYLQYPEWFAHPAELLNHEIGHILSLDHTYESPDKDGCLDTPPNPNCWAYPGASPCDVWANISNNIMDYTQWYPHVYSPCQVTRIQNYLNGANGNYLIHSCNDCTPANAFAWISSERCVLPEKYYPVFLNCQGSYNINRYLYEICEIANSTNANCIGGYYNSGWQNGTPSILNLSNVYSFQPNKFYKIRFSGDNTSCPSLSSHISIIHTMDCGQIGISDPHIIKNPIVAPNPGNGTRNIGFDLDAQANVNIYLVNGSTGLIQSHLLIDNSMLPTSHILSFDDASLPIGQHYITITADNDLISVPFIKN